MRILWNREEVAILIEGYCLIKKGLDTRDAVIKEISQKLRAYAKAKKIDDLFRNENGISMKLGNIDYLFSKGQSGFKNVSRLEQEIFDLYMNDREQFNQLLKKAKTDYHIEW